MVILNDFNGIYTRTHTYIYIYINGNKDINHHFFGYLLLRQTCVNSMYCNYMLCNYSVFIHFL